MRSFYETWFGAFPGHMYTNELTGFQSYFLTFSSGARLEIMKSPATGDPLGQPGPATAGYAHLAFSLG